LSRNGRLYRTVYDVFPYFAEINPQRGVVWEKRFNLGSTSRMYGFKMLRDSSMILTGGFSDGPNYGSGFFIKLNSRRDSIFRRNFRTTTITSSSVSHFPNQIEELDNGDLLIGGYVWDYRNISQSTTSGQWGWLVRTDSLGCSLEQSSCRVATQDIEKGPLSIKGFPNPTTGIFTVDLSEIPPNQKTVFKMYNTVGQLVMSQKLDSTADKIEFDARNLIEGFYIFTLNTEGGQIVANGKLQVQR
jgi:Secretion system C-terminal sorting domain